MFPIFLLFTQAVALTMAALFVLLVEQDPARSARFGIAGILNLIAMLILFRDRRESSNQRKGGDDD